MNLEDVGKMVGEESKTELPDEKVIAGGRFILLMVGAVIFIGGMLGAFTIQNYYSEPVSDLNVTSDVNVTAEHLTLAFNQQVILNSLTALQVQHLCGVNLLVQDSNELIQNEQGTFVTYTCYARIGEVE